ASRRRPPARPRQLRRGHHVQRRLRPLAGEREGDQRAGPARPVPVCRPDRAPPRPLRRHAAGLARAPGLGPGPRPSRRPAGRAGRRRAVGASSGLPPGAKPLVSQESAMSELPRTAAAVAVGGGGHGASIAYHLAKKRAGRVVLVEKKFLASGPTGRSTAVVRRHYAHDYLTVSANRSADIYRNWKDIIGDECGYSEIGWVQF